MPLITLIKQATPLVSTNLAPNKKSFSSSLGTIFGGGIRSIIASKTFYTLNPVLAEICKISSNSKSNYSNNYSSVAGTSAAYASILLITGIIFKSASKAL